MNPILDVRKGPNIGERLGSMILDHFIMTFVMSFITVPFFVTNMISNVYSSASRHHQSQDIFVENSIYFFALGVAVYLNKDIFQGRSPAKRIVKLQVIDRNSEAPASPIQCLIRNLTAIIWPVEVIMTLVNPEIRLGDRLAGTRVTRFGSQPTMEAAPKTNWRKVLVALLVGIAISSIIMLPFKLLMDQISTNKIDFVESSLNELKTEEANKRFAATFGDLLKSADFLVYDQIENDNRKYVSAIFIFKNRDDFAFSDDAEEQIENLLYELFAANEHIIYAKYVYKEPGSISTFSKTYRIP